MIEFILVTLNPSVKFLLPIDQIAAIREPLPNDELQDGTQAIVVMKIPSLNLFVKEDISYFIDMLTVRIPRKLNS